MIRITKITDVAREAGVSITTVSRVINGNYPVKEDTRKKVERAIIKLNYEPNQLARSLITKRSSVIGIVVPSIANWFFSSIIEDIEKRMRLQGYYVNLCTTNGGEKEERTYIKELLQRCVDGIIVMDPNKENIMGKFYEDISKVIPLIVVNSYNEPNKFNFISYDEEDGVRDSLEYLISNNRRRIMFIRGKSSRAYDIRERIYNEVLSENNIDYRRVMYVENGNSLNVVNDIRGIIQDILNKEECPNAIFAANDLMAVGVINALKDRNVSIPRDIAVIGCDNTLISQITTPSISSIDLGINKIGGIVVKEIIDLINSKADIRKNIILNTKFIIRESSRF